MIFFVLGDGEDGSSKKEIDAEWEGVLQRWCEKDEVILEESGH